MSCSWRQATRRFFPWTAVWLAALGVVLGTAGRLHAQDSRKFVVLLANVPKSDEEPGNSLPNPGNIRWHYFDPAADLQPNIDSFAEYWAEISYNDVQVTGDVFGWVDLPWPVFPEGVTAETAGADFEYINLDFYPLFNLGGHEPVYEDQMAFSQDPETGAWRSPLVWDEWWTPGERFEDVNGDGQYTDGDLWVTDFEGDEDPNTDLDPDEFIDIWPIPEPFDDVGVGDPPEGAGNDQYDEGEPFDDWGADGINYTGDMGEGNGVYDPNADATYPEDIPNDWPDGAYNAVGAEPYLDWGVDGVRDTGDFGENDCQFQEGEWYADQNLNGEWDPPEPFLDWGVDGIRDTGDFGENDGSYQFGEPFADLNGDWQYTYGEPEDTSTPGSPGNLDGTYDPSVGEEWIDQQVFDPEGGLYRDYNGRRDGPVIFDPVSGNVVPTDQFDPNTGQRVPLVEPIVSDNNCNGVYDEDPTEYIELNDEEGYQQAEPYEDFLVRYDPEFGDPRFLYMVPVAKEYIFTNYPGNLAYLWWRTGNGQWDGPDRWLETDGDSPAERTTKMIEVPGGFSGTDFVTPEPYADLNNNNWYDVGEPLWLRETPTYLGPEESPGGFWQNYYGSEPPDDWDPVVHEVQPFDPEADWLSAFVDPNFPPGLLDDPGYIAGFTNPDLPPEVRIDPADLDRYRVGPLLPAEFTDRAQDAVVPTAAGLYYDGVPETDDLPSSIYHLRSWADSRRRLEEDEGLRNPVTGQQPMRGVGDGRLGEITSPYNDSIWGHDRVGKDGLPHDGRIMAAGPYANNIHGDGLADGGNLLSVELLTRRTDGTSWTGFADFNCDGLIDQGEVRAIGTENYVVDGNPWTPNNGAAARYPYNRRRLVEDVVEALDRPVDWDNYFQNRGTEYGNRSRISGTVLLADDLGASPGPSAPGQRSFFDMTVPPHKEILRIQTQDDEHDERAYAFSEWAFPLRSEETGAYEFAVPHVCATWLRVWEGYPDLYDYDVHDASGSRPVNKPVANWCIMGANHNFVHPVGPLKYLYPGRDGFEHEPWIQPVDLRTALPPGEEKSITMPPVEFIRDNAYYFYPKPDPASEQSFWFWQVANQGFDENMPGWGLLMLHADLSVLTPEGLPDQRGIGERFHYRIVQADGLRQLENGENDGDAGDPWPGATDKRSWNEGTNPSSTWYEELHASSANSLEIIDIEMTSPDDPASVVTFRWLPTEVPSLAFEGVDPSINGELPVHFSLADSYGGTDVDFYVTRSNEGFPDPAVTTPVYQFPLPSDPNPPSGGKVTRNFMIDMIAELDDDGDGVPDEGDYYLVAKLIPGVGEEGFMEADLAHFPAATNRGNGFLQNAAVLNQDLARAESWAIVCIEESTPPGSEKWQATPSGDLAGEDRTLLVTTGQVVNTPELTFTITAGSKPFRFGDRFVILTTGWKMDLDLQAPAVPSFTVDENGQVGPQPLAVIRASPLFGYRPSLQVLFNGSESSDPEGHIVYWDWDFGDGTTDGGLADKAIVNHSYTLPNVDPVEQKVIPYTVTLTVTNNRGARGTESVGILLDNYDPFAQLSVSDEVVGRGETVTFTYDISDPEGDAITSKTLDFGDGSPIVNLTSLSGQVNHDYDSLSPGNGENPFVAKLTVEDEYFGRRETTVNISVVNRMPFVDFNYEVLSAGDQPPFEVRFTPIDALDGSTLGSTDDEGDTLYYTWGFGDGSPSSSQRQPTHTYQAFGRYPVTLVVTDDYDQAEASHTIVLLGLGSNNPPNASFNATVSPSDPNHLTIDFNGSASNDPDGDPLSFYWSFGDNETASGLGLEQVSHTYAGAGVYLVTLTVNDGREGQDWDSQLVAVGDLPNHPPVARIAATDDDGSPADRYGEAPLTVTFDASSSYDPDGEEETAQLTFTWTFGDGGTGVGVATAHTYSNTGTFKAQVTARDPHGASNTAFLYVTVIAAGGGGGGGAAGGGGGGGLFGCGAQATSASLTCLFGLSLLRWRRNRSI